MRGSFAVGLEFPVLGWMVRAAAEFMGAHGFLIVELACKGIAQVALGLSHHK